MVAESATEWEVDFVAKSINMNFKRSSYNRWDQVVKLVLSNHFCSFFVIKEYAVFSGTNFLREICFRKIIVPTILSLGGDLKTSENKMATWCGDRR